MKILCLGAGGRISRESVKDLIAYGDFEQVTIGDVNEDAAREVAKEIGDPRVDIVKFDITDSKRSVEIMKRYDLVMSGMPIKFDELLVEAVVKAKVNGLDINGMGDTFTFDGPAREAGIVYVPGVGMTPGTTNILTRYAADQMERVDEIYISHGAFRAISLSPGLTSTTFIEYDPTLESRVVYDNGKHVQVSPFSLEKMIELPQPYGTLPQYVIPHPESFTIPKYIKGVKRIEVRGTWPEKNMRLVRALYDYGFLRNDKVKINGGEIGSRDFIAAYLDQSPEGRKQDLWGYALHVEVVGMRKGKDVRHVLTTTHPSKEAKGWEDPRGYTKCVGIPLSIGAQMIAKGKVKARGIVAPEGAFDPLEFIRELAKREIRVHEKIEEKHTVH
jgi:saccharopine dehydrogenase-like NADP-dependent oxidoreductase